MKHLIITISFFCSTLFYGNHFLSQAIKKNDVLFESYYGYKLMLSSYNKTGPIGCRAEYMLSHSFGLGIDYCYLLQSRTYTGYEFNNPENQPVYNDVYTRQINSLMGTVNFYKIIKPKLTFKFILGVGYKTFNQNYYMSDEDDTDPIGGLYYIKMPIAFALKFGLNYYLTENVGINMSFGMGQGGIVNGGVCFKLGS